MIQEDATIFRTPRRQRKSCRPHGNAQRRRSLFADSKESDDDIASLSPTSSEIGTPIKESPVGSVKNLESNFNQLLLNRTPNKDFPFTPPRLSPRIKGVRCLSEDADLIKKNTFYGGRPLGAAATAGPVDGKSLFASIRSTIHQRVRTQLFPDDAPAEKKKRGRSASYLDSAKRAKKRPRLQESLPSCAKNLISQKQTRLKEKMAEERASLRRIKEAKIQKKSRSPNNAAEKNSAKKTEPAKRKYNWEIFSSGGDARFSRSLNSSVTMTPPATGKKKKLISSFDTDFLSSPHRSPLVKSSKDIEEINKEVSEMIEDEEIGINCKVDDLLSQLEQSDNDENEPNNFENAAASTPVHLPSTPSSSSPMDQKFFPIFNRTPGSGVNYSFGSLTSSAKKNTPALKGLGSDQMLLDCGQSKLREVQCPACDLLYVQGVPEDEAQHSKFHHTFTQMIYNGFKSEYVVGLDGPNKIVMARPQGGDARYWNKALDFKRVVDFELGAPAGDELPDQIYLYISGKNVTGFLSACRIKEAHRLLPPLSSQFDDPKLPALCSEESFPAKCGVTRLWVSPTARKRGIAKAMMDALRRNFLFGTILALDHIAMSSPTADGRLFSTKYFKRDDFLVY